MVKHAIQTIIKYTVSILTDVNLPDYLWYEICLTITYLGNLKTHSHLQNDVLTLIQAFTNKKLNLSHLWVIRSKAHVLIPKEVREYKFKPRAFIRKLIDYNDINQY